MLFADVGIFSTRHSMKFGKAVAVTKEELRAQSERAMKEAMERKLTIKQVDSRKEVQCGKCGGKNKITIEAGATRAKFKCKECGVEQTSL
jgi:Zn finger protein HypA/HybF involved in hydrogenase expression